jgi:hypothetical protein
VTEAEWEVATNPTPMLWFHRVRASRRKWRLFCCACGRRVIGGNAHPDWEHPLNVGERLADGEVTDEERLSAAARDVGPAAVFAVVRYATYRDASPSNARGALAAALAVDPSFGSELATTVRCLFGNPFQAADFDPQWRTADVMGLARAIYDDRAFDRMPILADALLDAGCDDEDILSHCRSSGPHVRGCWVVDLVLGKE